MQQDTELSVIFSGLEVAMENRWGKDKHCGKWFECNTTTVVEIGAVAAAWKVRILHCRVEMLIWNAQSKEVLKSDVPMNYVIAAGQLLLQKLFLLLLNHKKEDCGLAFRAHSDTVQ